MAPPIPWLAWASTLLETKNCEIPTLSSPFFFCYISSESTDDSLCSPLYRNISEALSGPRQTNQRAELTAILRALEIAPQHRPVVIYSDSTYAINCCKEWAPGWIRNGWRNARGQPVENRDLIQLIVNRMDARHDLGVTTDFSWVKGHAGDPGNVAADYLANRGAQQAWPK